MSEFSDLLAATRLEQLLRQDLPTHDHDGDPLDVRAAVTALIATKGVSTAFRARSRQVTVTLDLPDDGARQDQGDAAGATGADHAEV